MIDIQITMTDGSITRVRKVSPVQTKRGAETYEREVREALLGGTYGRRENEDDEPIPTLTEMFSDFIAYQGSSANKRPNRPRTLIETERMFRAYLEPTIGTVPVDRITARQIDRLTAKLQAGEVSRRPLKHNTVANILGLLRRMLNVARRWGHVDEVPEITSLKRQSERLEADQWLTEDETTALIEAAEPRWAPVIIVAVRTGLRVGELQGLRWSDVDLDTDHLLVERSWSDHIEAFGPPKGGRSREVPLAWDAAQALRSLPSTRSPRAFVFSSDHPFHQNDLRRALARARDAAGLDKHVHVHMLRHSWASHCTMQGIPSRVVMTWGGWTSEAMLNRYAHLEPRKADDLIQRIAPTGAPLRVVGAKKPRHHGGTGEGGETNSGS